MCRITKKWVVEWNGHQIAVENWWDFLLRGGEELFIDGIPIQQERSWARVSRDFHGEIIDGDKTHQVRVHIGGIAYGIQMGCQIFVNEELIGGDIDKKFIS
jgi:hypothetical protein